MLRWTLVLAALALSGCVTHTSMSPGVEDAKNGVWVSRVKALGMMQFGDAQLVYCVPTGPNTARCTLPEWENGASQSP